MPVLDRNVIECPKCGLKMNVWTLRRKETNACLYCREPLQALIKLDGCDWGKDFGGKTD